MSTVSRFRAKGAAFRHSSPDYHALDQGKESTVVRHRVAAEIYSESGGVIDFGCGTGLLLDVLATIERPSFYIGVDMFPERESFVMKRAHKVEVPAYFRRVTFKNMFENVEQVLKDFSAVEYFYMIGLWGYRDNTDAVGPLNLKQLIDRVLYRQVFRGAVSVPACESDEERERMPSHLDYMELEDVKRVVRYLRKHHPYVATSAIQTKPTEVVVRWSDERTFAAVPVFQRL